MMLHVFLVALALLGTANAQQEKASPNTDQTQRSINLSYHHLNDDPETARFHAMEALRYAHSENDKLKYALTLYSFADVYRRLGDLNTAKDSASTALRMCVELGARKEQAEGHELLATIYRSEAKHFKYIEELKKAAHIYNEDDKLLEYARTQNMIGVGFKNMADFDHALTHYLEALDILKKIDDTTEIARVYTNLGVLSKNAGNNEKALEYHRKSLDLYNALSDQIGIGNCFNNMGVVYKNMGNYELAIDWYREAIDIWKQTNDVLNHSRSLNNMGVVYALQERWEEALITYEEALEMRLSVMDLEAMPGLQFNIGEVHLNMGHYAQAERILTEALAAAESSNERLARLEIYKTFARLMSETNRYEEAFQFSKAYTELNDSIYGVEKIRIIEETESKYRLQAQEERAEQEAELRRVAEENAENAKARNEAIEQRNILLYIGIGGITILGLLLTLSVFRRYRQAKRSRMELEEKNRILQETLLSKEEKEILLREIHHRVKNNMQIISSLIRLQAGNMDDPQVNVALAETQNRIKSMALVHEELYQTKDLAKLDVKQYIQKLIDEIIRTYNINTKVTKIMEVDSLKLGIDSLIPIGLIINEVISNSLKYAFKQRDKGVITIRLSSNDHRLKLYLADDGKGADNFDPESFDSLGMDLIGALTDQLDGTYSLETENGFAYAFDFPDTTSKSSMPRPN